MKTQQLDNVALILERELATPKRTMKDTNINQELINAAKCALLDLQGALEVEKANDPFVTLDVIGVKQTIKELKIAIAKATK